MKGVMNQRRGRRRQSMGANLSTGQSRPVSHSQVFGRAFDPAPDASAIDSNPWNTRVLEFRAVLDSDTNSGLGVTFGSIKTRLETVLKLQTIAPPGPGFQIRVMKSLCYLAAVGSSTQAPDGRAVFWDFSGQTSRENPREERRAIGTLSIPATAGYEWPAVDTKEIVDLSKSDATIRVVTLYGSPGLTATIRVQILWKAPTDNPQPATALASQFLSGYGVPVHVGQEVGCSTGNGQTLSDVPKTVLGVTEKTHSQDT